MEYKIKSEMMDNRMVNDSHKEGIHRVLQKKSERNPMDCEGHNGKLGMNHSMGGFRRSGSSMTPTKA